MMFTRLVSGLLVGLALVVFATIAAGAEQGDAGGGDLSPIPRSWSWKDIQGDLAIWTAVVFLVLLLVLWKLAWRPLAAGLEKREQGIADQIAQAENNNQQARQLLAQYQQKLADSQDEVRGILEQARRDAEQLTRDMLETAKQEAKAEQRQAVRQIDAAAANALKELAAQGADLAVELAGKILNRKLDAADHASLIERAVADFAGERPAGEK